MRRALVEISALGALAAALLETRAQVRERERATRWWRNYAMRLEGAEERRGASAKRPEDGHTPSGPPPADARPPERPGDSVSSVRRVVS